MLTLDAIVGLSLFAVIFSGEVWTTSLQGRTRCSQSADCSGHISCSDPKLSLCTLSGYCICHHYNSCEDCNRHHICKGHQPVCFRNTHSAFCACGGTDIGLYNDTIAIPITSTSPTGSGSTVTSSNLVGSTTTNTDTIGSTVSSTTTIGSTTGNRTESKTIRPCTRSLNCHNYKCSSNEIPICKYDKTCDCLLPHYCKTKDDCINYNCSANHQATCRLDGCHCISISTFTLTPAPQTSTVAECSRSSHCLNHQCSPHHEIPYCRTDRSCGCLQHHTCSRHEDCTNLRCHSDQHAICKKDGCHCEKQDQNHISVFHATCSNSIDCRSFLCNHHDVPYCQTDKICGCLHDHSCGTDEDCINLSCPQDQHPICQHDGCHCSKHFSVSYQMAHQRSSCNSSIDCRSNFCVEHTTPFCQRDKTCGCLQQHFCTVPDDCTNKACPQNKQPQCKHDGCHCVDVSVLHQNTYQRHSCRSSIDCRSNVCLQHSIPFCQKDKTCGCLQEHFCDIPDDCANKVCPQNKETVCRHDGCHCVDYACYSSEECYMYCPRWEQPVCMKEGCRCYQHRECHECYKTLCHHGFPVCHEYYENWPANCTCQRFPATNQITARPMQTFSQTTTKVSSTVLPTPSSALFTVQIGSVNINVSHVSSSQNEVVSPSSVSTQLVTGPTTSVTKRTKPTTSSSTTSVPSKSSSSFPKVTVSSKSSFSSTVSVPNKSSFSSTVSVPKKSSFSSTVSVPNKSSFSSTVSVPNKSSFSSTVSVPSKSSFPSTVAVPSKSSNHKTTKQTTTPSIATSATSLTPGLEQQTNMMKTSGTMTSYLFSTSKFGGSTTNVAHLPGFSEKNSRCNSAADCTRLNTYISLPFGPIPCTGSQQSVQCIQDRCYCKHEVKASKGPSLSCHQCGDIQSQTPCPLQFVFLGTPTPCQSGQYCQTDIHTDSNNNRQIYKRCVDETTCLHEWLQQSSDKEYCVRYGQVTKTDDYTCSFCCIGDNCNSGLIPKNQSLYGSVP